MSTALMDNHLDERAVWKARGRFQGQQVTRFDNRSYRHAATDLVTPYPSPQQVCRFSPVLVF
jgi:hypothetical protein